MDNAELRRLAEAADHSPILHSDIEAIRARHEAWVWRKGRFGSPSQACLDRGHLLDRIAALEGALRDAEQAPADMLGVIERRGYIFDKWPADDGFDTTDPETRWQGLAFSLYTKLVKVSEQARAVLADGEARA